MALLSTFAYYTSANLLQEISQRQLDALAESKRRDVTKVYESWTDKLRLVRSDTQLKASIRDYVDDEDPDALHSINRVIQAMTVAVLEIDRLIVFDLDGKVITAAGRSAVDYSNIPLGDDVQYIGTFLSPDGLRVAMNTAVEVDGALIGGIEIIFNASDVIDVTSDYTGLGDTGETIVVDREDDRVIVLNPLRHEVDGFSGVLDLEAASSDLSVVFSPPEGVALFEHTDYRGEEVWLATRFLEELGWGLVVKVDISEEEKRADGLREALIDISVALSAFAIIGGALLGFYLARPIQELAVVVDRVRHGESELRAEVNGDDEIAYLAESLNEFLDHLDTQNRDDA
jgi:HAMP domain-containing protein